MKRYRYLALAIALGAMGITPTLAPNRAQAATPMDLEFQTYRSRQNTDLNQTLQFQTLNDSNADGHSLRDKLIYSE